MQRTRRRVLLTALAAALLAGCGEAECGNGLIEPGEACDDANAEDGDGCDTNCTETGCRNGVITAPEACDDGNNDNGDGCDANCTPTACGNGVCVASPGT